MLIGFCILFLIFVFIICFIIWAYNDYNKKCNIFKEDCKHIEKAIFNVKTIEEAENLMNEIKNYFYGTSFSYFKTQFQIYYHQVKGIKIYLENNGKVEKV